MVPDIALLIAQEMGKDWHEHERKQWGRIEAAEKEAERFLNRVAALRASRSSCQALSPPENAAMKRASLDLSKSLVLVRKERWQ